MELRIGLMPILSRYVTSCIYGVPDAKRRHGQTDFGVYGIYRRLCISYRAYRCFFWRYDRPERFPDAARSYDLFLMV